MRAISLVIVLALATSVQARKWTDASGTYSVEAEFVGVSGELVILQRENGKQLKVPLAKLSIADQAFVRSRAKGKLGLRSPADALQTKSKLEFTQTPLRDVLAFIRQAHRVPVFLDRKALEEAGLGSDSPVTVKGGEQTLAKNLDAICRPLRLTWLVAHDVLFFTTLEKAEAILLTRVYRLKDPAAALPVRSLIQKEIDSQSWNDMGGPGSIVVFGKCLVISQQRTTHEKITALKKHLQPVAPVNRKKATPVEKTLSQVVSAQFLDAPLQEVIKFFAAQAKGVKIRIDEEALEQVGLGTDTPVSANIAPIPLRSTLTLILGELGLTWTYEGKNLLVTTPEAAEQKLITTLHDVNGVTLQPGTADGLIRVLTRTISPSSWEEVGGPGTIEFSAPVSLKVAQTRDVHEQIANLIATLRGVK